MGLSSFNEESYLFSRSLKGLKKVRSIGLIDNGA